MGDNGERFIGQASGPFTLPCHMHKDFQDLLTEPKTCIGCAGAAIYRSNCGYPCMGESVHRLPKNHDLVFSNPEQLLAHHRGVTLDDAKKMLENHPVSYWLASELSKAKIVRIPIPNP